MSVAAYPRDGISRLEEPFGERPDWAGPVLVGEVPVLRSFLLGRRCPPVALDDLTQETLKRFWGARDRAFGPDAVRLLLLGIGANVLREWRRDARRVRFHLPVYAVASAREGGGERVAAEEIRGRVREAVEGLLPAQRQAVWLFYFRQLPAAEAAAALGCSCGAFRWRLCGAYRCLRRRLADLA